MAATAGMAAIATHIYLYQHHLQLRYGRPDGNSLCDISGTLNCNAAAASSYSELFGVPMAMWGLLANLGFLIFLGFSALTAPENRSGSRVLVVGTAAFIALTSVAMGVITVLFLPSTCPFCVLSYLISFVMLGGAVWTFRTTGKAPGAKAGVQQADPIDFGATLKQLGFVALPLFLLGFVFHSQLKTGMIGEGHDQLERFTKASISNWLQAPSRDITTVSPLVLGPERSEARLTIVEFADFRCGHCRSAAPVLKSFVQANPDVRLEFQTYPLDGTCNSNLSQGDGESCLLARVVLCAEKLHQKGWAVHNFVFENQSRWRGAQAQTAFADFAAVTGGSADELKVCTESADIKSAVEGQVRLGTDLGVQGTPSVFVNGKKLEGGHIMPILLEASAQVRR